MKKEPDGQLGKQRSNVVLLRGRAGVVKGHGALAPAGIDGRREPTGDDVITMLLGCAPASILDGLDLSQESSAEWASVIESKRIALEPRERVSYTGIAGLALTYAFLKRSWHRASPSARDTLWQAAVPFDVLLQFGESLRCEIEDRESGIIEGQDRHYSAVVVALKADRDAARAERDALKAAATQGKRKRSDDARKGSEARWAEEGSRGKPADKAKAKYEPRMLAWLQAHPTPEKAKNACSRYFHPMIYKEYGKDAPDLTTVRAWLKGK